MLRKRAEQFEEFLQQAAQGEKTEGDWAGLVQTAQKVSRLAQVTPLPPRRLSPGRKAFLSEAVRLREARYARRKRRLVPIMSNKMKLAGVVVATLLFFAAVSGTGYALADNSLPGEPLYGLKGAVEQVRLNLTHSTEARAELAIRQAEQRMAEISTMLQQGQPVGVGVARQARSQMVIARQAMEQVDGPQKEALQEQYQYMLQNGYRYMYRWAQSEELPPAEGAALGQLLQWMWRNTEQTRTGYPWAEGEEPGQLQQGLENAAGPGPQGAQESVGPNANDPYAEDAPGQWGPAWTEEGELEPPKTQQGPVQNEGAEQPAGYGPGAPRPSQAGPSGPSQSGTGAGSGSENSSGQQNKSGSGSGSGNGGH